MRGKLNGRAIGIALLALFLSGCVSVFQPPANYSTSSTSVPAEVGFRSQVRSGSFQAFLDGVDVTAQFSPQPPAATTPKATLQNLAPGAHQLQVSADTLQYWFIFPYYASGSDTRDFTVTAPPLSFSPSSRTISVGSSGSVTVNTPAPVASMTTVTLSSGSPGIASVPATTTIAAGSSASPPVTISALAPGLASITASAPGFAPASLSVTVPTPTFEVTVSPANADVVWGSSATYTVTVRSRNGFSAPVGLTVTGNPDGSTPSFSSTPVTPPANGTATSTLTLATTEAVTRPGRTTFRVIGSAGAQSDSQSATVNILRKPGAFSGNVFPLRSTSTTCGLVTANIVASGGVRVEFISPLGTTSPAPLIGGGYQISPGCRAGIVVPPLVVQPFVNLFNLQFPPSTGARGINDPFNFPSGVYDARYSQDESLVSLTEQLPTGQQSIVIVDLIRQQISTSTAFNGILSSVSLAGNDATVIVNTTMGTQTFMIPLP